MKEYDCPLCQDKGYIRHEIIEEDGYVRGECEPCPCQKAKRAKRLIEKSGLAGLIDRCDFETFETSDLWQERMKAKAREYLKHLQEGGKNWLFLAGAVGCGKTHLCTAVCGEMLKGAEPMAVRYMQWLTDSRKIKSKINDEDLDEAILDDLKNAELLYIDDLFKQQHRPGEKPNPTASDIRIAFEIINARYVQGLPTIISTEWSLINDLWPLDEGTFSRVYEKAKMFTLEISPGKGRNYRERMIYQGVPGKSGLTEGYLS